MCNYFSYFVKCIILAYKFYQHTFFSQNSQSRDFTCRAVLSPQRNKKSRVPLQSLPLPALWVSASPDSTIGVCSWGASVVIPLIWLRFSICGLYSTSFDRWLLTAVHHHNIRQGGSTLWCLLCRSVSPFLGNHWSFHCLQRDCFLECHRVRTTQCLDF